MCRLDPLRELLTTIDCVETPLASMNTALVVTPLVCAPECVGPFVTLLSTFAAAIAASATMDAVSLLECEYMRLLLLFKLLELVLCKESPSFRNSSHFPSTTCLAKVGFLFPYSPHAISITNDRWRIKKYRKIENTNYKCCT